MFLSRPSKLGRHDQHHLSPLPVHYPATHNDISSQEQQSQCSCQDHQNWVVVINTISIHYQSITHQLTMISARLLLAAVPKPCAQYISPVHPIIFNLNWARLCRLSNRATEGTVWQCSVIVILVLHTMFLVLPS